MTKPIIVVKMPSCKLLYVYHSSKRILGFLALSDIKDFGHLHKTKATILMLLLIGLALFYSQAVFV